MVDVTAKTSETTETGVTIWLDSRTSMEMSTTTPAYLEFFGSWESLQRRLEKQ